MNSSENKPRSRPNDMTPEEFRRYGREVVDWIADYLAGVGEMPVEPRIHPGDLVDALPPSAPVEGEPMDRILADFREHVLPAVNHWNHPRFHAYFAITASGPGILGEMLAAALNTNGMLWKSSPANTELEMVVMSWLRQWIGLPETFFGMIHDTASTATMHAIAAGRAKADPSQRTKGAEPRFTVYTSEHAHSSVEKGALSLGIGQQNVRKIGVDAEFRMRPELLEAAIEQDLRAGLQPCCIVSTTGTTSVASVDPVEAVQQLAERYNVWHHVDAAYGGSAAVLPELRWMLEGAERADSLVMNPHKWLFTPVDCSAFYCRKPDVLKDAFSLVPSYLQTEENPRAINLMDYGVPLGRRFRAIKLWFVMRWFGLEKVQQVLRNHIAWAQELGQQVDAHPQFELCAPVHLSLVCLRLKGGEERNRQLAERINQSGRAFIAGSQLRGRHVLRFAIGNLGTTREDIQGTWELMQRLAEESDAG